MLEGPNGVDAMRNWMARQRRSQGPRDVLFMQLCLFSSGLERGRIIGFGGSGRGGFGPGSGGGDTASPAAAAAAGGGGDEAKAKQKPPALLEVDRRVFGRVLLSPDSLSDHLPDTYLSYLRQL